VVQVGTRRQLTMMMMLTGGGPAAAAAAQAMSDRGAHTPGPSPPSPRLLSAPAPRPAH